MPIPLFVQILRVDNGIDYMFNHVLARLFWRSGPSQVWAGADNRAQAISFRRLLQRGEDEEFFSGVLVQFGYCPPQSS